MSPPRARIATPSTSTAGTRPRTSWCSPSILAGVVITPRRWLDHPLERDSKYPVLLEGPTAEAYGGDRSGHRGPLRGWRRRRDDLAGPPADEADRPRRLFQSMPSPLALLAFALRCLWRWEPTTPPFNVPNGRSGWSAGATLNRRAELLDATYEVGVLVNELGTAARAGKVLDARWGRQLSQVRLRWRLTGSTTGRLTPMEQKLLAIILEVPPSARRWRSDRAPGASSTAWTRYGGRP